jgi:hypothetical protein
MKMSNKVKTYTVRQTFTVTIDAEVDATSQKEAVELAKMGAGHFEDESATLGESTYRVIGKEKN